MTEDRIDDGTNQHGVEQVGDKARPLRHGAGNNGGSRGTEDRLENEKGPAKSLGLPGDLSQGCTVCSRIGRVEKEAIGNYYAGTKAEHQSEPYHPEDERTSREVNEVFHEDVANVLGSCATRLDKCKPCLHKENEKGSNTRPENIGIVQ